MHGMNSIKKKPSVILVIATFGYQQVL